MKENIEGFLRSLISASKTSRIKELRIIEKTKSVLKARLYFSEDIFVQIYVNVKRPKKSYALVINDTRIFGKDFIFGAWHAHPFKAPLMHDDSVKSKKPVTIEEFVEEAVFILSENLGII
ncbi:MAG: hypothetical protein HZC11_08740 [Nitrospirae bacterium]|nr:hypothetical protein [Nitrospirota bacterium]